MEKAAVIAETKRLIIREFTADDLDALYGLYDSAAVRRFVEPPTADCEAEKAKLEAYIRYVYGFYGFGLWAVCLKPGMNVIGRCGIQIESVEGQPEYEIGYLIRGLYQKQGYALESIQAVVRYACEYTDAERLVARILPENEASIRTAARAGFKKIKVLPSEYRCAELYALELPLKA